MDDETERTDVFRSAKENPLLMLAMFLGLALFALACVYVYTFFVAVPENQAVEAPVAQPSGPPIRIAYQPMPWPDLDPDGGRIELQAHIQPYDDKDVGLLCERMPQIKDVINLVLSQFDKEEVAKTLDLAVVEEQLTNALNDRLGDHLIRGAFIDVGTTTGAYERMRLFCYEPAPGGGGGSGSGVAGVGDGTHGQGNKDLSNWFERAAQARARKAEKMKEQRELGLIE